VTWPYYHYSIQLVINNIHNHRIDPRSHMHAQKHASTHACMHACTHTHPHTHTTVLQPSWILSGTTWVSWHQKVKPIWIYWSKRLWVAVASAGPYANLHLDSDTTTPASHHLIPRSYWNKTVLWPVTTVLMITLKQYGTLIGLYFMKMFSEML